MEADVVNAPAFGSGVSVIDGFDVGDVSGSRVITNVFHNASSAVLDLPAFGEINDIANTYVTSPVGSAFLSSSNPLPWRRAQRDGHTGRRVGQRRLKQASGRRCHGKLHRAWARRAPFARRRRDGAEPGRQPASVVRRWHGQRTWVCGDDRRCADDAWRLLDYLSEGAQMLHRQGPLFVGHTYNSLAHTHIVVEGDGQGAAAVALYDSDGQSVTNLLVTAPGVGYTVATAKVYCAGSLAVAIPCVLADNDAGGSFTKAGAGCLTLTLSLANAVGSALFSGALLEEVGQGK